MPVLARVSMMPKRNSTTIAPRYTSTWVMATNSAASRMYWAATPASTSTSQRAACTRFLHVTTRIAPKTIRAAMT